MQDFIFYMPTKILFGDQAKAFVEEVSPLGDHVLVVYGGGSIKKNGIYEEIVPALQEKGVEVVELAGVEPNPRLETAKKGVSLCRERGVDFILAIGGGSSIDCAKLVAAAVPCEGDPWDIVTGKQAVREALPLVTVLTLSATGSEMDTSSVISRDDSKEKLGWASDLVLPKVSLLNPAYTKTVNAWQTASGTADIMSHTMENYFTSYDDCYLQDSFAEGLLRTCLQYGPVAVKEPENLEARQNLMWAGSWAINGLLDAGKHTAWSVHPMEHELSAYFDITHGAGLAVLTPHWLTHVLNEKTEKKIARFARRVFDCREEDDRKAAEAGIAALAQFFRELGLPKNLEELKIKEEALPEMAQQCIAHKGGPIPGFVDLTEEDVLEIYRAAYRV